MLKKSVRRWVLNTFFDEVFDIKAAGYTPKPHRETYDVFLNRHDVAPQSAAMFDDLSHNLEQPHALGMTTVLVCSEAPWLADEPSDKRPAKPGETGEHIHHATDDLTTFLKKAAKSRSPNLRPKPGTESTHGRKRAP